jgi:hypothetical protein
MNRTLGARRTWQRTIQVVNQAPLRSRSGATTVISACLASAAARCSMPGAK